MLILLRVFVDIVRLADDGAAVLLHGLNGKPVQAVVIGFKMDDAAILENRAIEVEEPGGGKPFFPFAVNRIGVGKRDPYFRHFARAKVITQFLDKNAQKRHVVDLVVEGVSRPCQSRLPFRSTPIKLRSG
mgnify:CR=1 FL=1